MHFAACAAAESCTYFQGYWSNITAGEQCTTCTLHTARGATATRTADAAALSTPLEDETARTVISAFAAELPGLDDV